jgi:chromosome segregation ATPase
MVFVRNRTREERTVSFLATRKAVNAKLVSMLLENDELQQRGERLISELFAVRNEHNAARELIKELQDTIHRQQSSVNRLTDDLNDEKSYNRASRRTADEQDILIELYQLNATLAENIAPFGIEDLDGRLRLTSLPYPAQGDKIPTIKFLRSLTNIGLKEAKDIVESWEEK